MLLTCAGCHSPPPATPTPALLSAPATSLTRDVAHYARLGRYGPDSPLASKEPKGARGRERHKTERDTVVVMRVKALSLDRHITMREVRGAWVIAMLADAWRAARELDGRCERCGLDSYEQAQICLAATIGTPEEALWSQVWDYIQTAESKGWNERNFVVLEPDWEDQKT